MNKPDKRKIVTEIFNASLKAVDPYISVEHFTDRIRSVYTNSNSNRLVIAGFGKAACPMAKAIEDTLGNLVTRGIVITKYGHAGSQRPEVGGQHSKITIFEAGHPVPDENGVKGTGEIIRLLKEADENTLIVCLISGGGSALLVSPYKGITLNEKQKATQLLLKAGANIEELNTVRKHISGVKGGRLAEAAYPARVVSLMLSDVIGDRLDVIASGPTSPDPTTYDDALKVMKKYGLIDKTPAGILDVINKGAERIIPDTPEAGNIIFERVENLIIGSNRFALDAAKQKAGEIGFHAEIISAELTGEARNAAKWLASEARKREGAEARKSKRPLCLISGGETTVTVKGNGLGGRNTEFALAFAMEIEEVDGVVLLSAGTDGTDGPTDAAGAIVDGETIKNAKSSGIDPETYLMNNDSYNFFKKIDSLFITGPTGTNVMDLQIVLLD